MVSFDFTGVFPRYHKHTIQRLSSDSDYCDSNTLDPIVHSKKLIKT